jgi:hypothetical protein
MQDRDEAVRRSRTTELVEAVRETPGGEGVADALEFMFDNAPPFELDGLPSDPVGYVKALGARLAMDAELCDRVFENRQHAFLVGREMADWLALHGRQSG